jgi:heat shock protein HtpX
MVAATFLQDIRRNRWRSVAMLVGVFGVLFVVVNLGAYAFGAYTDQVCTATTGVGRFARQTCTSELTFRPVVLLGLVAAVAAYLVVAYLWSGRTALALAHAEPADPNEHRVLHDVVEEMSIAAGIPKPSVWVVDDAAPNAFATGRDPRHASIAVTTGLLDVMSRRELEGVVAHETSHIANHDIAVSTLAVLAVGLVVAVADIAIRIAFFGGFGRRGRDSGGMGIVLLISLLLYVIAIPAALLLKAALSRRREAMADETGVRFTREPGGLRSALEKLESSNRAMTHPSHAIAHLWIESPLPRDDRESAQGWLARAFDTHPPLADRIAELRAYEGLDPAGRGPNDPPPRFSVQPGPRDGPPMPTTG